MLHTKTLCVYLKFPMKKTFNGVLVVEGSNDASYISSFVDAIIVTTNGYEIPKAELDFLSNLPKDKNVFILTDSDEAGNKIRERLNQLIPTATNLYVEIDKCNKRNKHGVAECDKEELLKVLENHLIKHRNNGVLTLNDLYSIGLDDKNKRDYLSQKLHLGKCNNKTLLKRINYLGISLEEIKATLKDYGN